VVRERDEVPNRPRDNVTVAMQIALALLGRFQHPRNVARHRGFLGDHRDVQLRRHSFTEDTSYARCDDSELRRTQR